MTARAADRAMRELAEDRGASLDRRLAALRFLRDHATSSAARESAAGELYRLDPELDRERPVPLVRCERVTAGGELCTASHELGEPCGACGS